MATRTNTSNNGNSKADFAPLTHDVALALLGEPNPAYSSKTELRYGSKGSLAIDLTKGVYHDHETDDSGGVLGLIQRERGVDKNEAITWLVDHGFIRARRTERGEIESSPVTITPTRKGSCFIPLRG